MARISSVWAAGEMVVQVISLTRNVSVFMINVFRVFSYYKVFHIQF